MQKPLPFGKYLLLERISVGGMAEVFQAKSFGVEGFEKIIAIKRILPSMAEDADFIQMFIDEAKIAGQLSHANICQIYELGKIGESHFIAMEYIWGKDLLQIQGRLRKLRQKMPVPMVCHIASKVCEGLDYAHRKKDGNGRALHIIHRDVSPQNILVSYEGEVKVIDFGIAKAAIRSSRTQAGVLKGKFGYMSPEQVRGLPLDRRSDLFAIGTMLYESLTGERLFANDSDFATLERVRNAEVEPPSRLNPKIPPELERIVMKALARDVEDRYQWANELQDDLHQLLVKMGTPYSPKQLASWMKEAFEHELARERTKLDAFKKLGPAGALPASASEEESVDSTFVNTPSFEQLLGAAKPVAASFGDEAPTKIFGEVASDDIPLPRPSSSAGTGVATEPGRVKPMPPVVLPIAATVSNSGLQSTDPLDRSAGSQPILPLPGPALAADVLGGPSPAAALGAAALGSNPGQPVGSDTMNRIRRGSILRDIAIGAGAAVLFAAIIAGAYMVGTRVLGRRVARSEVSPAASRLVVATGDAGDSEVFVNGVRKGLIRAGEPLTIDSVPVGEIEVRVKRPGMPDCVSHEVIQAHVDHVVTCAFKPTGAGAAIGSVLLAVATEGATVLVDKQEISPDAAREPLILSANASHEIVIKREGYEPQVVPIKLNPGQVTELRIELVPLPPLRREPPPHRPTRETGTFPMRTAPQPSASPEPPEATDLGYLTADTTPWASVFVDDVDTHKKTPIAPRAKIPITPGKHKVTFVVGNKQYSYTIMVAPGQDYHLEKRLTP